MKNPVFLTDKSISVDTLILFLTNMCYLSKNLLYIEKYNSVLFNIYF